MAKKVDELLVYQKVLAFEVSITAILDRPVLRRDKATHAQIVTAVDSIQANIEEGFEQKTDKAFAHFLNIAKGSSAELIGHFRRATRKNYLTEEEVTPIVSRLDEIGRMLGGLIKYLDRSDYKDRGRFRSRHATSTSGKAGGDT